MGQGIDEEIVIQRRKALVIKELGRLAVNETVEFAGHQITFNSEGMQNREDVEFMIADTVMSTGDLARAFLAANPMLERVYNEDGTRKNAMQLIAEMQENERTINEFDLPKEGKQELLAEGSEMYHRVIYRALETATPEEIAEITQEIGSEALSRLLTDILEYFNNKATKGLVATTELKENDFFSEMSNDICRHEGIIGENEGISPEFYFEEVRERLARELAEKKAVLDRINEQVNQLGQQAKQMVAMLTPRALGEMTGDVVGIRLREINEGSSALRKAVTKDKDKEK